ncbi:hypothetical protein HG531_000846 [Fusarium graminearum]|nr:hypothetical protein HG531_000846 [Fusarium graminearum]
MGTSALPRSSPRKVNSGRVEAGLIVTKPAISEFDKCADETRKRERLVSLGVDQMVLGTLGKGSVCLVAGEVTQTSPFENERTEGGDGVVGIAIAARVRIKDDFIVGDATGCVKGDTESVCKSHSYFQ